MRRLLAAIAGLAAVAAVAPPAHAQRTVTSGPLQAVVTDEAGVDFRDADGDVLSILAGGLAFAVDFNQPLLNSSVFGVYFAAQAPLAKIRATGVASSAPRPGGGLRLLLDTQVPGARLGLDLVPLTGGRILLEQTLAQGGGPAGPGIASRHMAEFGEAMYERFMGFGSRSNAVDQKGQYVYSWAEEGPFSAGDYEEEMRRRFPSFTFPTGNATTNFPVPWLLSSRGFGVLIDQTERSVFDLRGQLNIWRAEAEAPRLRLVVHAGPQPADALRRYSDAAGRQPAPPRWLLGPWVQFRGENAAKFAAEDVPTTVAQTYTHYLPCGAGRDAEAEKRRVAGLNALGMEVTTYFNPHICTSYEPVYSEAAAKGLLVKDRTGRPYTLTNPFTADQVIAEIDFSHPEGRALYGRLTDEAIANGYRGWMEDFGEYTPSDAVMHDGTTGLQAHNRYPVDYHCASTAHSRERAPAVFIRSGFHGAQPCARAVWGGDPTEDWSCSDGLCAAVHQLLNMGMTGFALQGSDIGGFHSVVNPRTDDELTSRWLQVGFASGIMRTQSNGYAFQGSPDERSQVWSPAVQPIWRRYAKLRTQLAPYLEAALGEYRRTALPLARHLQLAWPGHPAAVQDDVFLLGPDLLVAPVLAPGSRTRSLQLPPGRWIDLWRSARYEEAPGRLVLGEARIHEGGSEPELPAPLEELPVLVKAGALLTLLPADVDTLADRLAPGAGIVRARDRRGRVGVLAFPAGRTSARTKELRMSSVERRRRWTLDLRAPRRTRIELQASLAALKLPPRPCRVLLGGRRLPRRAWRYDRRTRVLTATLKVRRARLDVRGCQRP